MYKYCNLIIENNVTIKNEFYTTIVIKQMLNDNKEFINKKVENKYYFSLGTPKQVESFKKTLLLDLDGTLVNTDFIYLEVWKDILKKYNLIIDENFYNHFIKGKSDGFFLKYLLTEITDEEIIELSVLKDDKFIEYINVNKVNILHENVIDFLEKNKNKMISIVTSCNRKAAEFLVNYTNIHDYINLIVSADDCKHHKPNPEPYLMAIHKLKVKKENFIIFEDSLSGYKSAVNAEIKNISLKINIDTNNINNSCSRKLFLYK